MIYISADPDLTSSKDFQLQREQPRRCQRETLAAPTGIMALNSLMCVCVCLWGGGGGGGGWSASGAQRLQYAHKQTACTHPRAISQAFTKTQRLASNSHTPDRGQTEKVRRRGVCMRLSRNRAPTRLNIKLHRRTLQSDFILLIGIPESLEKVLCCASPLLPLMFTVQIKDSNGVNLP